MSGIDAALDNTSGDACEVASDTAQDERDDELVDHEYDWYARDNAQPDEDDFAPSLVELRRLDARARRVFKVRRMSQTRLAPSKLRSSARRQPPTRRARRRARRTFRSRRPRSSTGHPSDPDPAPSREPGTSEGSRSVGHKSSGERRPKRNRIITRIAGGT